MPPEHVERWRLRSRKPEEVLGHLGVPVKEILGISRYYILYIDDTYTLRWYFGFDYHTDVQDKEYPDIVRRAVELQTRIQYMKEHKGQNNILMSALRLIGQGLRTFFTSKLETAANDPLAANAALDTADKYISQRSRETSRLWYFIPLLLCFGVSCIAIFTLHQVDPKFAQFPSLVCAFGGGIGAFISGVLRSEAIPIAVSAGRWLHWLEATLRWCVGLVAGFAVWLLVTGNLAASFLNNAAGGTNMNALIAIALLAGASERLLPSLIKSFDDSIVKQNDKSKPKAGDPALSSETKTNDTK